MTFKLPTIDQIRSIGAGVGMDITESYAKSVIDYVAPFAEGYRNIVGMPDDIPPVKYPRTSGYRPEGEENKYGAWAVKISIKGAKKGKLAGKKVAVKDTYALAGVPLTNGASVLEGYVPEFDATIVTRLLDAGAEVVNRCANIFPSQGALRPVSLARFTIHAPGVIRRSDAQGIC
jgi:amidase